ncbi:MAG: hypothetical protein H0U99_04370, partial [Chthoniobacterales bacterium]|nr:hypothetical protein [Chthoniobacterales bacterium]
MRTAVCSVRLQQKFGAILFAALFGLIALGSAAQQRSILLKPEAVFDGEELHRGWSVLVTGDKIAAVGATVGTPIPTDARTIDLPGQTLLPGLIEGHSHMFLHPYNEA